MSVSNPFIQAGPAQTVPLVVECRACPRLVAWREAAAQQVPLRFARWVDGHGFWGRPVPAFGDPGAWLAVVGLAPAAQGGNRTGRMFTGDRSGDFLYAALHRAGLASQAASEMRGDGLTLRGCLVTAAVRCAPPGNRPERAEIVRCRPYLLADLGRLERLRVVLALGRIAHDAVVALLPGAAQGGVVAWTKGRAGPRAPNPEPRSPAFGHGAEHRLPGGVWLVDSYHVSQRNTFTGLLTPAMFDAVLARCRVLGSGRHDRPRATSGRSRVRDG
jgi:uracil-DNA glycosylase family 4